MIGKSRTSKTYVKNDILFTPPEIFELLNIEFDLDVCAPVGGISWIPAKKSYSEIDVLLSICDTLLMPVVEHVWLTEFPIQLIQMSLDEPF